MGFLQTKKARGVVAPRALKLSQLSVGVEEVLRNRLGFNNRFSNWLVSEVDECGFELAIILVNTLHTKLRAVTLHKLSEVLILALVSVVKV